MDRIRQDFTFAIRQIRRSPAAILACVATLALGIGATTAVFSVVSAVLLRGLPYERPDRLFTVAESSQPNDARGQFPVSPGDYLQLRDDARTPAMLGAFDTFSYNVGGSGAPERLIGAAVSANLLPTLGVRPALGRTILASDDRHDASRVVMISDGLWRRRFGADPQVIGRSMTLNGEAATIVGVMPRSFRFPAVEAELWVPIERQLSPSDMHWRGSHDLTVVGRLRDGATLEAARAEMNALMTVMKRDHPEINSGAGAVVVGLQETLGAPIRPALLILLAAVTLLLIVTCANVGNLMLVRATRAALGAGRSRIAQQFLTESMVVAIIGGVAGVALAHWIKDGLLAVAPEGLPRVNDVTIDARVLATAIAITVVGGVAIGLVPAWILSRTDESRALRASGRTAGSEGRAVTQGIVAAQIAACIVLLGAAGLLVRTLVNLRGLDLAFDAAGATTARVSLPDERYRDRAAAGAFFARVMSELRRSGRVTDAALTTFVPLTGSGYDNSFEIEGRPLPKGEFQFALNRMIDQRFLPMFGIPIVAGRNVAEADTAQSPPVVVINEAMARRYWPGMDPVGRRMRIHIGDDPPMRQIVGVARDVRVDLASDPAPTMYVPFSQLPSWSAVIAVRGGAAASAAASITEAVQRIDPGQPIYQVRDMAAVVGEALRPWRFSVMLVGGFAVIALVICAIGIAGVASHAAAQRTAEIGVRMALGATQADIVWRLVKGTLQTAAAGVACGSAAALAATPMLRSQLYGVTPEDATVFAWVVGGLVLLALIAAGIPAVRASHLDPNATLREE